MFRTTDEQDIANDSNDTNNAVAESSQIDCYNQYHYCDEVACQFYIYHYIASIDIPSSYC